jgi:hypothetical protein
MSQLHASSDIKTSPSAHRPDAAMPRTPPESLMVISDGQIAWPSMDAHALPASDVNSSGARETDSNEQCRDWQQNDTSAHHASVGSQWAFISG